MTLAWKIRNRSLPFGERTLVMGILNVTPDSFSDGSRYFSHDEAIAQAERMIAEGADIVDVGGESTRPGSVPVSIQEEIERIVPIVADLTRRTETPISVDTTKSQVARAALAEGAAIINDISALRFDFRIADEVATADAGLVLMHSRGTPATMHRLPAVADVMQEVTSSLRTSINMAQKRGVRHESIAIDPGIGFGKSQQQNLELIAKLEQLVTFFDDMPILIGTSNKSFIGRILENDVGQTAAVCERFNGTIASVSAAVLCGAHIVRVHDVRATREAVRVIDAIRRSRK
ncbi:MAG: dihydropteroate synthase [Pyrinomonadaceae bacterium]